MTSEAWIQTFTGKKFDLLNPENSVVTWRDICVPLARINRFLGATSDSYSNGYPWSVAEHSLLVWQLIGGRTAPRDWQLAALLHDAHEAYVGDLPRPVKLALRRFGAGNVWEMLAGRIQRAIHAHVELPHSLSRELADAIHRADQQALALEYSAFLKHASNEKWTLSVAPPTGVFLKPFNDWARACMALDTVMLCIKFPKEHFSHAMPFELTSDFSYGTR